MDRKERGDRRIGVGELLEDPHAVEASQSRTADVVAAVHRAHAQLGGLPQYVDREVFALVPFEGKGAILRAAKAAAVSTRTRSSSSRPEMSPETGAMSAHRRDHELGPVLIPDGQRDVTVLVFV